MTKQEIKKSKDNELIREYVSSYGQLWANWLTDRGTKQLSNHCKDLEAELLNRNILTEEDIRILNM